MIDRTNIFNVGLAYGLARNTYERVCVSGAVYLVGSWGSLLCTCLRSSSKAVSAMSPWRVLTVEFTRAQHRTNSHFIVISSTENT